MTPVLRNSIFLLGLLGSPALLFADPQRELGQREYAANCAICHGPDGKGGERPAPDMPDLTLLSSNNGGQFPVAQVYGAIDGRAELRAHGLREMPVWGNYYAMMAVPDHDDYRHLPEAFVRSRILALIDYLQGLQQAAPAP
ncbi:c-type cytochrome [Dechloromonas denitrificans]|nr:cytochrome c [Dechloromonas denitrificans]